ncbi:RNA methyltransferase [Candidatus Saccharibacteria bacterium]|nr:RNA methyltransferase [Candidatus Saccharibacteria bacterium]
MSKEPGAGLTLVLDNLRSCHNVGSIIRTANGFGCRRFAFIGTTPYPRLAADGRLPHQIKRQTDQIAKTALGAEAEIEGRRFDNAEAFLAAGSGRLICLEQTPGSQPLSAWRPKAGDRLIVGSELDGVSAGLIAEADCFFIPMQGSKESFNVAAATAIALYHFSLR